MVAELNPGRGSLLNQLLKYLLTAKQWKPPQVASVQINKVENVVNKMIFFSSLPVTQQLKMGTPFCIQHDHFSVDDSFNVKS